MTTSNRYDPVGNVIQVTSSYPWMQVQNFTETFTYDAYDQLTTASETQNRSYTLSVSYDNWGKMENYDILYTDLLNSTSTQDNRTFSYPAANSLQDAQTLFAPEQRTITDANNNMATETLSFGINGSLRKREVQAQPQTSYTEYYLFNGAANLKAYSNNGLDFAYYGYNASNTRAYKLSMLNQNQWVNGQPEPLNLQLQSAMFYPNAYVNFNHNGEYTKHYYNGTERICSRLGENTVSISANSNDRFGFRIMQVDQQARAELLEVVEAGDVPIETPSVDVTTLQVSGNPDDIFYYHTNHLGSTAFITDNNTNIHQGFLYAPFGEITTEYDINFGYNVLPKYAFNAKELDEETGMYYYEARYYKPPVFTSRDPMFEKYFWMTPYAYCANNPVKYVDPSGKYILPKQEAAKSKVFANYVNKQMLSDVMASPTIINALMKYGQFKSDADIRAVLTNGYGPQINIVDREKISGANGYYTGVKNGSINIASDLIDLLNNSNGEDREAALFLIVNVLLHETVHYGDWQDGDSRDNQGVFFIDGDVTGILKGDGCGDKGHLFQSEVYLNNQWDKKIETLEEAKQALKEIRKSGVNNDVIPTIP